MLELPAEKSAAFGLNARKFKVHNSGDKNNRSLWTETPNSESSTPKVSSVLLMQYFDPGSLNFISSIISADDGRYMSCLTKKLLSSYQMGNKYW